LVIVLGYAKRTTVEWFIYIDSTKHPNLIFGRQQHHSLTLLSDIFSSGQLSLEVKCQPLYLRRSDTLCSSLWHMHFFDFLPFVLPCVGVSMVNHSPILLLCDWPNKMTYPFIHLSGFVGV